MVVFVFLLVMVSMAVVSFTYLVKEPIVVAVEPDVVVMESTVVAVESTVVVEPAMVVLEPIVGAVEPTVVEGSPLWSGRHCGESTVVV